MKFTFRKVKKLLLAAALICCAVIFASCGATVDTEFTADSNFAGTRVITLTLSNSDLSEYVPGGRTSIEATIKKYMPDCLSYTITEGDDNFVCKFTLAFTGIDDYKTKVAKVLAAEKDDPITGEIEYENIGSPFKASLKLNENFSSMDLIGWLRYGLQQDGVVTKNDTSNWFENGDTKVTIGGTEYRSYNNISVDESVYNTPDEIVVKTYFLTNGNFDRTVDFYFSNDTLTSLSEQGVNVENHFKESTPAATVEKTTNDYQTIYHVGLTGLTAEQIVAETGKIFHSEDVIFSASIAPDVNVARRMLINIEEKLDGSYYLRRDRDLDSIYFLYNGAEPSNTNRVAFSRHSENDMRGYSYTPAYAEGDTACSSFVWDVEFESAGAVLDFAGSNVNFDVKMYAASDMLPAAKQILNDALNEAVPEGAKLSTAEEDGMTVYTVDFGTKSPEDEAALYREFIYNYTGEKIKCEFELTDGVGKSPFKTVTSYSAVVEMSALSDRNIDFTFKKGGSLYILDNSQVTTYEQLVNEMEKKREASEEGLDEDETKELEKYEAKALSADYTGVFQGTLRFYAIEESINAAAILFLIMLIVCIIGFIAMIALNIKTWLAAAKEMPVKPVAIQAPTGFNVIAQNSVQAEDDEDEEEYV
ncbi:MAG: hypothetical protein J6A41_04595 [Ruminiclostridium sp.]|nr:hypothetical protein [Ruminiclostridium sp.]